MPVFVNTLAGLNVDDQYFMNVPVTQGSINIPTGNIGIVGTFQRGPLNTPVTVTSYEDLVKNFGEVDTLLTLTGTLEARSIFAQGNTNLTVIRIGAAATPPAAASVILKDTQTTPGTVMTLNAATPGTWGNSLIAVVAAGTITGTNKITLQYGNETEVWDNLIIQQPTTPITGAVLASSIFGVGGKSKLATATFPATADTSAWATGTFALTSGTNGSVPTPADYVGGNTGGVKTGISALDSANINIILCAGQSDPTINNALIANCQTIVQNGGVPRTAVITFPQGTAISGLQTLVTSFDTDQAEAAYPWQQILDNVTGLTTLVSPLGFFAGRLAQLKPQESTGNKPINGTIGIDPAVSIGPSELNTLASLQINVVGVPTPAGPIGIRGGFNLSKSSGSNQLYVRRMNDYIDELVASVGGQFVDDPVTTDLMRQVGQVVDNILYPMKNPNAPQDQMIQDYTINCSNSNNPSTSMKQGKLICDYAVQLLNMDRFMIFRTQISNGVVIKSNQQQ
jgi:phage tail sheath protein FI